MDQLSSSYDYIIAGMGCAGLSLAVHLIDSGKFVNKRILLVDKEAKDRNDRTWCFWETAPGLFEPIVFRSWQKAWFHTKEYSRSMDLSPYRYKMIRGIDFYNYALAKIGKAAYVDMVRAAVTSIRMKDGQAEIVLNDRSVGAHYIFNSILFEPPQLERKQHFLLQHFQGWVIKTQFPAFTPTEATLMDFRIPQHEETSFVYIMPFGEDQALVEYTQFSKQKLEPGLYADRLRAYLQEILGSDSYEIQEQEAGVIPMTDYRFPTGTGNIIHIGTAGGQTKGSTGYTFRFIQKQSAAITRALSTNQDPSRTMRTPARFHFYDSVLLDILAKKALPGGMIFKDLFSKNDPTRVLKFLDNETSIREEVSLLLSLPVLPFFKAALSRIF